MAPPGALASDFSDADLENTDFEEFESEYTEYGDNNLDD
jgi:hypothetical protein